jgi:AraC-like DNA-binding protein
MLDLPSLSVVLGYFSQPHFIRDFARVVGMTSVAYAEVCVRKQAPLRA